MGLILLVVLIVLLFGGGGGYWVHRGGYGLGAYCVVLVVVIMLLELISRGPFRGFY